MHPVVVLQLLRIIVEPINVHKLTNVRIVQPTVGNKIFRLIATQVDVMIGEDCSDFLVKKIIN
jgi:hypothetical protein